MLQQGESSEQAQGHMTADIRTPSALAELPTPTLHSLMATAPGFTAPTALAPESALVPFLALNWRKGFCVASSAANEPL